MSANRETELARIIFSLQTERDHTEERLKSIKDQLSLRLDEMKDFLVEEGKNSTGHIEGIGNFSIRRECYPSVPSAKLPPFLSWLERRGEGGMIKRVVDPRTLRKYLNDQIEALSSQILETREACADLELIDLQRQVFTVCRAALKGAPMPALERFEFSESDPVDLATKIFASLGVTSFSEYKVSHTGRGKSKI